jgi:ribonuclease BN (tRNA processing enzyme)
MQDPANIVHLDHVIGLPLFQPFFRRDARITLMGSRAHLGPWQEALSRIFGKPFWPVELADVEATVRFENLSGSKARRLCGADVSWCPVQHPQGCLSYRIETSDGMFVVATDREHGHQRLDAAFVKFCHGADLLFHDAQYTPQELSRHRGWGHSTWAQAARVAKSARVGTLVLTSHDPHRTDEAIDRIVTQARGMFPNTVAAAEGLKLRLRSR